MSSRQHDVDLAQAGSADIAGRQGTVIDPDAMAIIISGCEKSLRETGIIGALRFLNQRTRYRYTGLYQVEPPLLRNVQLFDRENPTLNVSGEVKSLHDTYCGIVRDTNSSLRIADALEDAHRVAHPAREAVLSYCGVPIRTDTGMPSGTLCHFDVRPRLLSALESQIFQGAAPLFARCLGNWSS